MGRSHTEKHVLESRWGTEDCARCGATIVLGEPSVRVLVRGRHETLCSACAAEPRNALWPQRPDALSRAA